MAKELSLVEQIEAFENDKSALNDLKKEMRALKKCFENEKLLDLLGIKSEQKLEKNEQKIIEKSSDFENEICKFFKLVSEYDKQKFLAVMLTEKCKDFFIRHKYDVQEEEAPHGE